MVQDICHPDSEYVDSTSVNRLVDSIAHVTTHEDTTITLKPINSTFQCLCEKQFKTQSGFRRHATKCSLIKSISFASTSTPYPCNETDSESEEELIPGCTAKLPSIPDIPAIDMEKIPPTTRTYDHAFIHACDGTRWTSEEQQRMISILNAYQLRPISLINKHNVETNALTHTHHLATCSAEEMQVSPVLPTKKRKIDTSLLPALSLEAPLYGALCSGPFSKHFLGDSYVEINDEMADFLNTDWALYPQMRFATSRVLAGTLLLNESSGQALVVNTVEVYGRQRTIDSHRECFKEFKNKSPTSSLPPPTSRYPFVWPTSLDDDDGRKLVIGTKVFNALVTSSLRLDTDLPPEVGPGTCQFILDDYQQSKSTRLFIKETAWKAATTMAKNKSTTRICSYDILYQLRQLRTRFHHQSTYFCCRSSNELTDTVTTRPYTVFTLANYDNAKDSSSYRIASDFFSHVALSVIRNEDVLVKQDVEAFTKRLPNCDIQKALTSILDLFDDDDTSATTIHIINNSNLNSHLETLAKRLSTHISTANESIVKAVARAYQ
ncbi:hypothetical protein BCR42DRAFT_453705 [Absidia repens]|uniref:Uncharacterized protein n=1 Tax=Absidia repens TaxID=90262 RepID=A0A1X2IB92_9FUNG|nr:hypothetical protein BCR42DRAFT_453705 [Absidia repens]